jgi:hypothetical protein
MHQSAAAPFRRLTATPPAAARAGLRGQAALLLRPVGAALLAWSGYIHLHLWLEGYRHIPVNGPLFLLDAVTAFALAAILLAWPRPLAGLLAAGFLGSAIGALLISLSVGLFGFRESIHASFVVPSLVIEAAAALVLLSWTLVAAGPLAAVAGSSGPRLAAPHHGTAPSRSRSAERIGTRGEPGHGG